ncbi:MAG TPA: DUF3108 domain-containing protein [Gemmatimonadaceae bacterium]|nr:DUF3108 domain-containing protein [Gemmatimonadaceae bacterium]
MRLATLSAIAFGLLAAIPAPRDARAQATERLPFAPGERLTFRGRVHTGVSGGGTLWVEGPVDVRGTSTWLLHSDMEGRVGPLRATDRNASWLDPIRMTALRYTSRERHIVSRHDDAIEIFPGERRWSSAAGLEGETVGPAPLDELSFLYYVRTLPLGDDTTLTLARHFDVARNPTVVAVVGREEIDVPAGRFRAVVVEMRVRDARRYRGEGTIRIHLSDDACRLILRLESRVPDAGPATLSLQSYEGVRPTCTAKVP